MLNFFDAADATRKIQPLANSASIAKLSDVKCLFMLSLLVLQFLFRFVIRNPHWKKIMMFSNELHYRHSIMTRM